MDIRRLRQAIINITYRTKLLRCDWFFEVNYFRNAFIVVQKRNTYVTKAHSFEVDFMQKS